MRFFRLIAIPLLLAHTAFAQDLPTPMVPLRLVNDYTGLLTESDQIKLNDKLLQFNNETSTQIFVVTWDDLQGYDIADFGVRLANNWKIGQGGKDNGILVLVSPANQKVTIQTGYGVEAVVTDQLSRRIIETAITPYFRSNDFSESEEACAEISRTEGCGRPPP